jgi:chemotaxis protein MotA
MIALIGSVIVVASVVIGFLMAGGNLLLLWHPSEIVVIIGAALGAFITSNSLKVVKASFANAIGLMKPSRYTRDTYVDLLKLIFDLLVKSRKEGLLAIENDIENPEKSNVFSKYPKILADHHMMEFITDCLRLMVGAAGFDQRDGAAESGAGGEVEGHVGFCSCCRRAVPTVWRNKTQTAWAL